MWRKKIKSSRPHRAHDKPNSTRTFSKALSAECLPTYATSVARSDELRSRVSFGPRATSSAKNSTDDDDDDGTSAASYTTKVVKSVLWPSQELMRVQICFSHGSENSDDNDTASLRTPKSSYTQPQPQLKIPDPMAISKSFQGIRKLPDLPAPVCKFLHDGRFTPSTEDADLGLRVRRNLVVVFQTLLVFEDCLVSIKSSKKQFALSKLQGALGLFVRNSWDAFVLNTTTKAYVESRTNELIAVLQTGTIPLPPGDEMTALLVHLIDRKIVFDFYRRSLRSVISDATADFNLVTERCDVVSVALCKMRAGIWYEYAAMASDEMRSIDLGRPWEYPEWVAEHLGADFKLPEEAQATETDGQAAIIEALDCPRPWQLQPEDDSANVTGLAKLTARDEQENKPKRTQDDVMDDGEDSVPDRNHAKRRRMEVPI